MFDGDGCLGWNKDDSSFAGGYWRWNLLAREEMLRQVRDKMAVFVDVNITVPKPMSSGNAFYINVNGRAAITLDALMSTYPIGLSRKRIHGHPHTLAEGQIE